MFTFLGALPMPTGPKFIGFERGTEPLEGELV